MFRAHWLLGLTLLIGPARAEVRAQPQGFQVEGTVEIVEDDVFWLRDGDGNLFRLTVRDPGSELPTVGDPVRVVAVNCGDDQLVERLEPLASQ